MLRRARELLPVTFAIISHSGAGCQAFPARGVPGREGLILCQPNMQSEPELMERLGFPEGFTCIGTVALGYAEKEFKKPKADEMRIEAVII